MATPTEEKGLAMLIKEHCSIDGEKASDFMRELKKLTVKDREDFRAEFVKMGYKVKDDPIKATDTSN